MCLFSAGLTVILSLQIFQIGIVLFSPVSTASPLIGDEIASSPSFFHFGSQAPPTLYHKGIYVLEQLPPYEMNFVKHEMNQDRNATFLGLDFPELSWKNLWIWGYAPFFGGYCCQLIIFKNAFLEYDHVHIFCCPSYESQCNIWLLVQICVSPFITFCLALQLKAHSEATSHLVLAENKN